MRPIRILLADDHDLFRGALRVLLHGFEGFEVIAEAGDGREALSLLKEHRADVVLMDMMMPGLNGLDATGQIVRKFPKVRVIILSMNSAEEFVLPALRAGASGYVLKNAKPAELERAIRAVARGETYLMPAIAGLVIDDCRNRVDAGANPPAKLTPRQREVLQLVAEGHSSKEISRLLGVSVKTTETYRSQLMAALDIHDIAGLTRYAIRIGIVSVES